jgi:hypothetical protein
MNRILNRYTGYGTAVLVGLMAFSFIASSLADNPDKLTTICYRGHTLCVDKGDLNQYLKLGATLGACRTSE